jgi:CII-binding regulator of phage lambda lysogenization HflD
MCRYMKACSLYIYHYLSCREKHKFITSTIYGVNVSLSHSGLPRILPSYFRSEIRARNPLIIRYVLTVMNLYRVLPYKGKVKLNTITDPFTGIIPRDLKQFIVVF